jgi:NAD(P)-dependent dehydrogenase (short-subunit alcohol dehydrogenase family)
MAAPQLDLSGRVAVVTGAAQGLGRAIAEELHNAGARLALADVNDKELSNAATALLGAGADVVPFVVDLADAAQVSSLPAKVAEHFGGIDILVNNAGVRSVHSYLEQPLDDWRRTLDINLTAPFLLTQGVVPYMVERGKGKIVNVASVLGQVGLPGYTIYAATKGGVIALTRALGVEWARHGIQVNAIAPGWFATPMTDEAFADPRINERLTRDIPMRRIGRPEEIGPLAVFLASSDSDFMTGQTIFLDGGHSAG